MKHLLFLLFVPTLLLGTEQDHDPDGESYDQVLHLYPGWQLVSLSGAPQQDFGEFLTMSEALPLTPENYWLNRCSAKVYNYHSMERYYPDFMPMAHREWDLNWAYYFHLDDTATWTLQNLSKFPNEAFELDPDVGWGHFKYHPNQENLEWFFLGYPTRGKRRVASIPVVPQQRSGHPAKYSYLGPFHWLIWQNDSLQYPQYDLKIVKTDDGRCYIPVPGEGRKPYDDIGYLEPGEGYFLGFVAQPEETYPFPGWQETPPEGSASRGTRSSRYLRQAEALRPTHFHYRRHTHWTYPIYIDTVNLALTPLAVGDEIGIFDRNLCVSAALYTGEFPLVITCWQDDFATTMEWDGYLIGDTITAVWYDRSANTEAEFITPLDTLRLMDKWVAPATMGFGNGFYALRSYTLGTQNLLQLPLEYKLAQNFPNPFNAETIIPLALPQRSQVQIELFNLRGQSLGAIYQGVQNAGWAKLRYNAARLASGVYFYRISAEGLERRGKFTDVGKMLILK